MRIIVLALAAAAACAQPLKIAGVSVSSASFNPTRGDRVELRFAISRDAPLTVKVWDSDFELVQIVADKAARKAGANMVRWDGKDLDGRIVPNEAYFFTIEAPGAVYDPIPISGGETHDITDAKFSRNAGTFTYKLSQPSRVLVRIGAAGGALLKTAVNWEPRSAGEVTEYWNGKDEDNLVDLWDRLGLRTLITYFTLPDTSVIAVGNARPPAPASGRPRKPERPVVGARKVSPAFLAGRFREPPLRATLSFPETKAAVPELRGTVLARVDVTGPGRSAVLKQQFEIMLYVDTMYFAEEERGYVPFNYPWELTQLTPGEHLLTVNLVTMDGRIAVGSRKVRVAR